MKKKGSRFNMQDSGVRLFLVGLIFFLMITNVFAETREFIFTVTDGEIELNGTRFMVWKYNDMFPGPEIRVKEGDIVKIKLRNMSGAKHGLFFHGL
ncbi:MAG: multicopper oxidase domain-containing protein [Nitrospirota bacterium]